MESNKCKVFKMMSWWNAHAIAKYSNPENWDVIRNLTNKCLNWLEKWEESKYDNYIIFFIIKTHITRGNYFQKISIKSFN